MWTKSKAAQILGLKYPIIQGPFGGSYSSVELVTTVSNLGGMGSFGLNAYAPEDILKIDAAIKPQTKKPYALNLWVPKYQNPINEFNNDDFEILKKLFVPYFRELGISFPPLPQPNEQNFEDQIKAILKAKPPVMSFIFGVPSEKIISDFKQNDILLIGTATSVEEAIIIENAGFDLVVASGAEAGGHRPYFLDGGEESLTDTYTLIDQVTSKVDIPVIAAGGIADGEAIAKALKLGASAVQIGTAFLATQESNASKIHKNMLLNNKSLETMLTKVYTGRLARAISNKMMKDFTGSKQQMLAPYPIQSKFLSPFRQAALEQGKLEYIAFWSGQPSAVLKHKSAKSLFNSLIEEITEVFS